MATKSLDELFDESLSTTQPKSLDDLFDESLNIQKPDTLDDLFDKYKPVETDTAVYNTPTTLPSDFKFPTDKPIPQAEISNDIMTQAGRAMRESATLPTGKSIEYPEYNKEVFSTSIKPKVVGIKEPSSTATPTPIVPETKQLSDIVPQSERVISREPTKTEEKIAEELKKQSDELQMPALKTKKREEEFMKLAFEGAMQAATGGIFTGAKAAPSIVKFILAKAPSLSTKIAGTAGIIAGETAALGAQGAVIGTAEEGMELLKKSTEKDLTAEDFKEVGKNIGEITGMFAAIGIPIGGIAGYRFKKDLSKLIKYNKLVADGSETAKEFKPTRKEISNVSDWFTKFDTRVSKSIKPEAVKPPETPIVEPKAPEAVIPEVKAETPVISEVKPIEKPPAEVTDAELYKSPEGTEDDYLKRRASVVREEMAYKIQRRSPEGTTLEQAKERANAILSSVQSPEDRDMLEHVISELAHETNTDLLTSFNTRRYALNKGYLRLNPKTELYEPTDREMALLDFDNFGGYNKEYGMSTGDKVLVTGAKILRKHIPQDMAEIVRYGGEEILIIPLDKVEKKTILAKIEDARAELKQRVFNHEKGKFDNVSFSGGFGDNYTEANSYLQKAKKSGKSQTWTKEGKYESARPELQGEADFATYPKEQGIRSDDTQGNRGIGKNATGIKEETGLGKATTGQAVNPTKTEEELVAEALESHEKQTAELFEKQSKEFESKQKASEPKAEIPKVEGAEEPVELLVKKPAVVSTQPTTPVEKRVKEIRNKIFDETGQLKEDKVDKFVRYIQDKMNRMRNIEEYYKIKPEESVYGEHELMTPKTANILEVAHRDMVKPITEEIKKAGIDFEDFQKFLRASHAKESNLKLRNTFKNPDIHCGITDEQAEAFLNDVEKRGLTKKYEQYANRVYDVNKKIQKLLVDSGLKSKAEINAWNKDYKKYVTFRGLPEQEKEQTLAVGKGLTPSQVVKKRMGRKSEAQNTLAQTFAMYSEAVINAEKNKVARKFYQFVKAHPNDKLWQIKSATRFKKTLNKETGLFEYKPTDGTLPDNYLTLYENGKPIAIEIKDPALAQAMTGMGSQTTGNIMKALAAYNRYLSLVYTGLNPEFVINNFIKDLQTGLAYLSEQQIKGIHRKVLKDIPSAIRSVYKGQKGKTGTDWLNTYKDWTDNGGKIGFYGLKNVDDIVREINNELKGGKIQDIKKFGSKLKNVVLDLNSSVENGIRLSTYKNLVEAGVPKKDAARASLNITLNFNKDGVFGKAINTAWIFANAGIQGNARMILAVKKSPAVRKIAASIAGASFALAELNYYTAGESPDGRNWYDRIPKYTRNKNMIIMGADGKYTKVPLGLGFSTIFWGIGQSLSDMLHSQKDKSEIASNLAINTVAAFSPFGTAGTVTQLLTPTAARTPLDIAMNLDYKGDPIYYESRMGVPKTEAYSYFKSARVPSKAAAQGLSKLFGGDVYEKPVLSSITDIHPDVLDYIWDTYSGGPGKVSAMGVNLPLKVAEGEDIELKDIPFARGLVGKVPKYQALDDFFKNKDIIDSKVKQLEEYQKSDNEKDQEKASEYEQKYKKYIDNQYYLDSYYSQIKNLNDRMKEVDKTDKSYEKELMEQMIEKAEEFNSYINKYGE